MSALIPVQVDANYDKDRELFRELNESLDINYHEGNVSFAFNIGKDDHFMTFIIDVGELLAAIGREMIIESAD